MVDPITDGFRLLLNKTDVGDVADIHQIQFKQSEKEDWEDINENIVTEDDFHFVEFKCQQNDRNEYDFRILASKKPPSGTVEYLLFEVCRQKTPSKYRFL